MPLFNNHINETLKCKQWKVKYRLKKNKNALNRKKRELRSKKKNKSKAEKKMKAW